MIKILYVDDEPINLTLFKITLSKRFEVVTADSGAAGLEVLASTPGIAIVISDMKMPHMNGLEFISIARDKYPGISFFILTGFDITDEIQAALNTGVILKYFRKPFNLTEIDQAIVNAMNLA